MIQYGNSNLRISYSEKNMKKENKNELKNYIKNTIIKLGKNVEAESSEVTKKRILIAVIFSVLTFLNLTHLFMYHNAYFLNFLVELVLIIVFLNSILKINMINVISKKIVASPDDNMEYIIASEMENANNTNFILKYGYILLIIMALIIPIKIFEKPHMIFEEQDGGYAVRYYTLALNNEENVVVPETHEGKPVISIRGNVFSNLSSIKTVSLPETLKEIRAEAFKNCDNLRQINIPPNVTEIKAYTFENDSSLALIEIPEGVTRIGAHAFYGCSSLSNVKIPSTMNEIRSSAFRRCPKLKQIIIPRITSVDGKAFKESPTIIIRK